MKKHHQSSLSKFFAKTSKVDTEENDSDQNFELPVAEKGGGSEQNEERSAFQSQEADIESYRRSQLNDSEKIDALGKLKNPPPHFSFPAVMKGATKRKLSYHWLGEFDWLIYSVAGDGLYCKFCFFFAIGDQVGSLLVQTPFKNYQKCRETFTAHAKAPYHLRSIETAKTLYVVNKNPEITIERLLTRQKEVERKRNLVLLKGIFDTINYLARQSLPFRGHRDSGGIFNDQQGINDGNFRNLIRLLASRDDFFRNALESSPKNATYLSSTMQNEIIVIMNEIALTKLLQKVIKSEFFSILADESSDVSGI